ncbi:hypothetical protein HGA64_01610 [Candidatus Falkowbacteria bacterium]|nr:hypothetical protein [Candidatus Falkowbacteria bacterium]
MTSQNLKGGCQMYNLKWVPGCGLLSDDGLKDDECPGCFGGHISMLSRNEQWHLYCNECGIEGGSFKMR